MTCGSLPRSLDEWRVRAVKHHDVMVHIRG
jgi:hypothetical protein